MFKTLPQVAMIGSVIGTGQCVAYVQAVAGCPLTKFWREGAPVKGNSDIPRGTAIACFDADGTYGNHLDGSSHAAIYLSQDNMGVWTLDQWVGQPVHQRLIVFDDSRKPVNNANRFSVIEVVKSESKPV